MDAHRPVGQAARHRALGGLKVGDDRGRVARDVHPGRAGVRDDDAHVGACEERVDGARQGRAPGDDDGVDLAREVGGDDGLLEGGDSAARPRPEAGSARRKPEACDQCAARGEAPSPATMRPALAWPTTSSQCEGAGRAGSTRVGRGTNEAGASSPVRPPSLGAGAWGVRGSRKATLSWTGPGAPVGAPVAAASARESWPTRRGEGSCGSRSTQARAWVLKRRAWSVAWEAPTPRSSPGRSALTTRRAGGRGRPPGRRAPVRRRRFRR